MAHEKNEWAEPGLRVATRWTRSYSDILTRTLQTVGIAGWAGLLSLVTGLLDPGSPSLVPGCISWVSWCKLAALVLGREMQEDQKFASSLAIW